MGKQDGRQKQNISLIHKRWGLFRKAKANKNNFVSITNLTVANVKQLSV